MPLTKIVLKIMLVAACFFLCPCVTALASPAVEDFIGIWASGSGNILEYRQNGQQIDVVMVEPNSTFKELGYLAGEITGHYQFSDGKITGKILLKFPGCQTIWASASNEISDNQVMKIQIPLLSCNKNTGIWESSAGTNSALLKRTSSLPTQASSQPSNFAESSTSRDQKQPVEEPPSLPSPEASPTNSSASNIDTQTILPDASISTKQVSPQGAIPESSTSAPSPQKSLKETIGGGCIAIGIILVFLGAGKRDRRFSSGVRGGSSTVVFLGFSLAIIGIVLIYISTGLLVTICALPFVWMVLRKMQKESAKRKEIAAQERIQEERERIVQAKMEEDIRAANEARRSLLAKYGDEKIVDNIISRRFWLGQTSEQLEDALGYPEHIANQTKSSEIWKYNETGKNRYALHIILKHNVVTDWKDSR